ncbi:hypothetical protein IMSHALPRED_004022 [Imshaugia aleurites]|uniref:Uncharacterized protein n=1 Tax=Imshaugia aleurites TaxID=172621 RepID=A0A8H3I5W2_9LECA|nr:hypothetical protein IMSHALPRED_004022 [Imshaugia aleurites]
MAIKYLDTCAQLPAGAPLGFPHIIDLEGIHDDTAEANLRIADMIVTVCVSRNSKTLERFIDLYRIFKYYYDYKEIGNIPGLLHHSREERRDGVPLSKALLNESGLQSSGKAASRDLKATNEEGILEKAPNIGYPVLNDKLWVRKAAVQIIVKDYAGWW